MLRRLLWLCKITTSHVYLLPTPASIEATLLQLFNCRPRLPIIINMQFSATTVVLAVAFLSQMRAVAPLPGDSVDTSNNLVKRQQ